jgi:hypothetical protein
MSKPCAERPRYQTRPSGIEDAPGAGPSVGIQRVVSHVSVDLIGNRRLRV